jgi:hypothetical protein
LEHQLNMELTRLKFHAVLISQTRPEIMQPRRNPPRVCKQVIDYGEKRQIKKRKLEECDVNQPEQWPYFVNSPNSSLQQRYYRHHLHAVNHFCSSEIAAVIAIYAAEGHVIGQKVDVRDSNFSWCVCEVLNINADAIKVHYVGWPNTWDEWIPFCDGDRIASLFFKTKPVETFQNAHPRTFPGEESYTKSLQFFADLGFQGRSVEELFEKSGFRRQLTLNLLMYHQFCDQQH